MLYYVSSSSRTSPISIEQICFIAVDSRLLPGMRCRLFLYIKHYLIYLAKKSLAEGRTAMEKNPIVSLDHVSFQYEGQEQYALNNVTFDIYEGEWLAIVGHNGSGKSTMAKLLNGLQFPQQGEITVCGIPLNETSIWDIRRRIGMVFQNPDNQFVGTTVEDDVAFGLENY